MSRGRIAVALVIAGASVAACGQPHSLGGDLLFLHAGERVAIVESGGGAPTFHANGALPSHDWSSVVRTVYEERSTRVVAVDPLSGEEVWSLRTPGKLDVKAVSRRGDVAILEPAARWYRNSPTMTRLVVARRDGPLKAIDLKGNFAPEALSTDAKNLFVVEYFPARNPSRYQVRRLDLETGRVHDVFTPDAELQESMRGTARIQAMSEDGGRLYTLYTLREGGARYAFIHVLALGEDELWAHCIDLPIEFARSAQAATALALAPDGRRLYVANGSEDVLAEVDTATLSVVRKAPVDFSLGGSERAHAAHGSGSTLYLADGRKLVAVDTEELATTDAWEMENAVTGVQEGSGAAKLYVGQGLEIAVIDLATGERLGRLDPPGVGAIGRMGKAMRSLDGVRTEIVCAC